jgi:sugar phosphate isomerase/epimerase
MIYPGLVSVTFRGLPVEEVIDLAVKAELTSIEWGGDVHVPHGDLVTAKLVQHQTTQAGLRVNAYGSYYQVGSVDKNNIVFQDVIDTAQILGALTIRVWAGDISSQRSSISHLNGVIADSNRIAEMAALAGISISFEYHKNTLTDTNDSARKLLSSIAHPNIRAFWQPHNNTSAKYSLEGVSAILSKLSDIHVFFWKDPKTRYPLSDGESIWLPVLELVNKTGRDHFASLEFVEGDSQENFLKDAEVLKHWIQLVEEKQGKTIKIKK